MGIEGGRLGVLQKDAGIGDRYPIMTGKRAGKSRVKKLYQNWENRASINIGEKIVTTKKLPLVIP
jgi:hypothetical protein